ncbi:sulfite oxidase heme-binding subunit YedZ [Halocynthiibacter sp.]|uniref:sulfite oxidase heme-binding subunit YedZ n=1 Tax=Halocynthiibacter sp. TaxID=1979210 RepID=UPI003C5F7164
MKNRFSVFFPWLLWVILAIPALSMLSEAISGTSSDRFENLLHPTGEFAARFMIISLLATPLCMLLRGWRGPAWLKRNRRYFGVAAFGYAALHLGFYVIDKAALAPMLADLATPPFWFGWLAFAIFVPLAVTSSDYFVRRLGPNWKELQRWNWVAAVLIVFHWLTMDNGKSLGPVLVHFTPLALLTGYRLWYWYLRPRPQTTP